MAERISVIVPAYNTAQWLPRCLDSLLAQTHRDMEIIVVNDGSTDDTGQVLDAYAASHPVKVIHQENGGVTSARLRGAAEATGDWLGFVDGDDEVEPQMYARLLENAHTYSAQISHCGQQVVFPDGRVTRVLDNGEIREQDRETGIRDLLDGGTVEPGLCTKLYRRELFGGLAEWMDYSIKNTEDLLMNFYLFSRAQKSVFEAVCPYHYILRKGSASYRAPNENLVRNQLRVRKLILENSEPAMEIYARQAMLRNGLFLYAWLATFPQAEFDGGRVRVREMLLENREYFSVLSARNRWLAEMICTVPWLFRGAYRAYLTLTRKKEEH